MKLAILAPSPYHFVMGGAEHLMLGLQRFITEETSHACEVVKLPTRESSLAEVLEAYRQHAVVDLLGFDRVMSCKYPAWMNFHPNHALYMLHPLRGLYDTYHLMGLPQDPTWTQETAWALKALDELRMADPKGNEAVLSVIDRLQRGIVDGSIPARFGEFPGPFARQVVHALDRFAFQPGRIASFATLSQTVAQRPGYFPPGAECRVIPPPPRMTGFWCGSDDYIFTVSRLDHPKRVDLLVRAMQHVRSDIPLWIAGEGPQADRLRQLADGHPRIRFLGPLSDQELLDAYAGALAVAFVPYDEDYGLVTIEAMRSGKPVITATDSGGVTEFVEHGQTGLCVEPHPEAIASAIDELCGNRGRAREMGREARSRAAGISWKPLAEFALGQALAAPRVGPAGATARVRTRGKAVVALTFGVTPPRGGGQSRAFHLYRSLAQRMDVVLVCLCGIDEPEVRKTLGPGLTEVRIPKSDAHLHAEYDVGRRVEWTPVTDIVAGLSAHLTPRLLDALDRECADADVVVACHPFLAPLLTQRYPHLPLWFEAQDVELTLKRCLLPPGDAANELLLEVDRMERHAWTKAEAVFTCTDDDLAELQRLYGETRAHAFVVPNGYAEEEVRYVEPPVRSRMKSLLGLGEASVVLFMGSWHGPNLESARRVLGYARTLPHVVFVIVGSCCQPIQEETIPANVRLLGVLDEQEKQVALAAADLALNPMTSGRGSNLKMLDYFAAGVPVLSTGFGARGIAAEAGMHFHLAEIDSFLPALVHCLLDPNATAAVARPAADLARARYSWRVIGNNALEVLEAHLHRPAPNR